MWIGRNWARIALLMFTGLKLLFPRWGSPDINGVADAVNWAVTVILLLLPVAAAVTIVMPAANAWFASRRQL